MKTRTEQLEFIQLNVNALSYCAWLGFQTHGRGVVCVPVDEHNEATQMVPFDFIPEREAAKIVTDWHQNRESRLVAEYDPKTEVVVLFAHSGTGERFNVDCYRFQPRPAPPMAEEP